MSRDHHILRPNHQIKPKLKTTKFKNAFFIRLLIFLLAILSQLWVKALDLKKKVGVYCSDIKGAFDRVCVDKLLVKCASLSTSFCSGDFLVRTQNIEK